MTLMADGEQFVFLLGDADHFFTLHDRVGHQFFGEDMLSRLEAIDGNLCMLTERHCDDDRFNLGMLLQQFLMVSVEVDLLGFGGTELANQAPANLVAVTLQGANPIFSTQIRDPDNLHIFGGMLSQQYRPFIASTDEADFNRITFEGLVPEVSGSECRDCRSGSNEKSAPRKCDRFMEVVFAQSFLFGSKLHGASSL